MLRADALLEGMPSRARAAGECLFVVTLLFVPGIAVSLSPGSLVLPVLGASFALWGGWALLMSFRRKLAALGLLAGIAGSLWATAAERSSVPPRLGIQLADREGAAEVVLVVPGSPADERLHPGDRIVAVEEEALDHSRPSDDLRERLRSEVKTPAGPAQFTVQRGERVERIAIPLPPLARGPQLQGRDLPWILLRAAAVLVVVAALLRADGQSARHIGLAREGLLRELVFGAPVLACTLLVHVTVSVPIALVVSQSPLGGREASQRVLALKGLVTDLSLWQFGLAMIVVAAFEEVVFRGFLLPRARRLFGFWSVAMVVVTLVFGIGHLYEGAIAIAQTAVLGVCFSVALLWRGHLGSAITAHAGFNTLMFTLLAALEKSGVLERLTGGQH